MQLGSNTTILISQAAYARLRKLNKSTISRQVARGIIPAHNGMINVGEADQARKNNLNQAKRRNKPKAGSDDFINDLETRHQAFAVGAAWLAQGLRDKERIDAMTGMIHEITKSPKAQALKAAIGCIWLTNAWILEVIKVELGKKSATSFDKELGAWIESLSADVMRLEAKQ